jgi:hypothetical protein
VFSALASAAFGAIAVNTVFAPMILQARDQHADTRKTNKITTKHRLSFALPSACLPCNQKKIIKKSVESNTQNS